MIRRERDTLREIVRYLVERLRRHVSRWDEIMPYQGVSMAIHHEPEEEPDEPMLCLPPWGGRLLGWLSRIEPSVASELEHGRCDREFSLSALAREPQIMVDLPYAIVSIDAKVLGMQKQNLSGGKQAFFATVALSFSSKRPLSGIIPDELWEGILSSLAE